MIVLVWLMIAYETKKAPEGALKDCNVVIV